MIREIQRQLMDIYRDAESGFFISDGDYIVHLNEFAANILNISREHMNIDDALGTDLANSVRESIRLRKGFTKENVLVLGKFYNIAIVSLGGCAFVLLSTKKDCEKLLDIIRFKARVIDALTAYQRTVFDTTGMLITNNIDMHYLIKKSMARALKVNVTISEISRGMTGKRCKIATCNLSKLVNNVVETAKEIMPETVVINNAIDENKVAFANAESLEKAIYSSVSALLYARKEGTIEVEFQRVNNQKMLVLCGRDIIWSAENKDYVYGKRKDNLEQDIHTYGYDILRASNLMEMQGGSLLVEAKENDAKIYLLLPEENDLGSEILYSSEEKYLDKDEAYVLLSDIL